MQNMSTCKLCKRSIQTPTEEERGDLCFKCIPNGIQIMWVRFVLDKRIDKWRWVVKTKELKHRRVTDSLFKNYQSDIKDVYRFKKYVSQ